MNMSMKPDTLLILAAVGIGAYWVLTRNSRAGTMARGALLPAGAGATVAQRPAVQDPLNPLLNSLGQKLGSWLGTNTPTVTGPDLQAVNPAPGSSWDPEAINGLF